MTTKTPSADNFSKSYETLKTIAETLRNQREPNVDELIPMLEEATKAYKICKSRLESVQLALQEYLPQSDAESTPPSEKE